MSSNDVTPHVAAAVAALLPAAAAQAGDHPIDETLHAMLWPYVSAAVQDALSGEEDTAGPAARADSRTKPWQYVARFWEQTANGPELVGETPPLIMHGTGEIVSIVRGLAAELHECSPDTLPEQLSEAHLKKRLPQLRNNLGRSKSAVLRVAYAFMTFTEDPPGGLVTDYLCSVDIYRVGE